MPRRPRIQLDRVPLHIVEQLEGSIKGVRVNCFADCRKQITLTHLIGRRELTLDVC